jgi:hypothetical protein
VKAEGTDSFALESLLPGTGYDVHVEQAEGQRPRPGTNGGILNGSAAYLQSGLPNCIQPRVNICTKGREFSVEAG